MREERLIGITQLCTFKDVAEMLSAPKQDGPHVIPAESPPLLTKPRAKPSESTRPHTFVHDCAPVGDAAMHTEGYSGDASVESWPLAAESVKFWLTPPLHCQVSTSARSMHTRAVADEDTRSQTLSSSTAHGTPLTWPVEVIDVKTRSGIDVRDSTV